MPASSRVLALAVLVLCACEAFGPLLGISDSVLDVFGTSAMKFNSAIGLSLCAVSIYLLCSTRATGSSRKWVLALGSLVLLLGIVTLAEYLIKFGAGIDRLSAPQYESAVGNPQSGRMSVTSAYCFVVAGFALVVASLRASVGFRLPTYSALAITLVVVGCFNVVGHLAESPGVFSWWTEAGMAISPAVGFVLVGLALVAFGASEGEFDWSIGPRIAAGFILGVLVMLVATGIAFNYTVDLRDASEAVSHTQEVLKDVEDSRAALATLVGGQQAFIATGDKSLLAQQEALVAEIRANVRVMLRLTADNPAQQARLKELEPLASNRLEIGADSGAVGLRHGSGDIRRDLASGSIISASTEKAAALLRAIGDEEFSLLGRRTQVADIAGKMTLVLLPLGVLVSLTILSVGLLVLNGSYNDRKDVEASARKLAAIVESSDDGMISKDLDSLIMSWNHGAETLFGYSSSEALGQSIMMLIPDDRRSEETEILSRIARGENVRHFETVRRRKDGQLIDVSVTVSPIKDPTGRIIGASKVVRDITERKKAEAKIIDLNLRLEERVQERTAQLEAANKELEAFSYSVSHDLRAPLRAMDGFSQAVLEDFGEQVPEEGRRYLQIIRGGAQRMGSLIDDLLAFSRLSRAPVERREVDMARLASEALAELGVDKDDRKIRVKLGAMPTAHGDPVLLKQVWVNLISNAVKYSSKRELQEIEIGCQSLEGRDVFHVKDNGTGFDMQYAGKLFGVFQRLHRSEDFQGTGVGLAIVQRVVHRHGGEVWADAAVDHGASFYFTLSGKQSHE